MLKEREGRREGGKEGWKEGGREGGTRKKRKGKEKRKKRRDRAGRLGALADLHLTSEVCLLPCVTTCRVPLREKQR